MLAHLVVFVVSMSPCSYSVVLTFIITKNDGLALGPVILAGP